LAFCSAVPAAAYTVRVTRITAAVALLALAAWCCLLFGIGLDDLFNRRTEPGVIFSVVVIPLMVGGLLFGARRVVRSRSVRRSTERS
jgi:hypothetical protein